MGFYWEGDNYFDSNGILAKDTTMEGYTVNADGAWTVNGVVQTKNVAVNNVGAATGGVNHSAGYDPAHPLAGKIDAWNLRITNTGRIGASGSSSNICNENVQALLTGQMDRAREIQKVMAQVKYKTGSPTTYYAVLIDHEGDCSRTAMTACALAKALGLKSAVAGTTDHMVYYIQVEGKAYLGQDDKLNLNSPTPDNVYFQ